MKGIFRGILILAGCVFVVVAIWVARSRAPQSSLTTPSEISTLASGNLRIGPHELYVELASTTAEHARGLSGREELPEDQGMLFLFSERSERSFWMKDTRIPLDLLWIRDGRIIGITPNVQPEPGVPDEHLRLYASPGPVDWVLETNGGWSAKYGIHPGDAVQLRVQGGESE